MQPLSRGNFDPSRFKREDRRKFSLRTRWDVYADMHSKPGTIELASTVSKHVFSYFNPLRDIRTITQPDINLFGEHLLSKGIGASTARMYCSVLVACLHYSRSQGIINQGYMLPKFHPAQIQKSREGKKAKRIPEIAETFKIISFIPKERRDVYLFCATHLVRPNEARALQAHDFNFTNNTVAIRRGFSRDTLSSTKVHEDEDSPTVIPLHPQMVERMRQICTIKEPGNFVFNWNGKRSKGFITESNFHRTFDKAAEDAEITGIDPYKALKHAAASLMASTDLYGTSRLARHKNVKTTEKHYTKNVDIEQLRRVQQTITIPAGLLRE